MSAHRFKTASFLPSGVAVLIKVHDLGCQDLRGHWINVMGCVMINNIDEKKKKSLVTLPFKSLGSI